MENSPTMLGPKGLIRKDEFIRIIIQSLYSLGYGKSAALLELESGVSYKSLEFEMLESQILSANWDDCFESLFHLKDLTDETRALALFLGVKQCLLECLNRGDDSLALTILQKHMSALQVSRDKAHKLARGVLFSKDMVSGNVDDDVIQILRKRLPMELEMVLPPPIALPERRLEHLLEMAVSAQIDSCMYHNSLNGVSLYEDHQCGRDKIPVKTVQVLTSHEDEVWFVKFSNSGDYLASSSKDCTAIIWKVLEDNKVMLKHTLRSHQQAVSFVVWSPDDTMLLTCGNEEVLKLWDVETGVCKHTFVDRGFTISSCAWFPDSKQLVCGSADPEKGIYMWDCEGNEIKAWKGSRMPKILDLAVTSDGKYLVSIFFDKEIRILNVSTNVEHVIHEEHPIASLSISADNQFLIVNLNSQEIHMWDVAGSWKEPLKYKGHRQHKFVIRSCFGGLNSAFIASGSENSRVYIWNRRSPYPIEVLSGHRMTVNCVSWNPGRPQMLTSASDDKTIRIWGPGLSKKLLPDKLV